MKILLADDSMTAQTMATKILKDAGFQVTAVSNGVQALHHIATTSPDLAILDIHMPGYSGLEVCERIRASIGTRHIPVLLAVGKMEPFSPEDSGRVMADGIIVKPFEASDLIATVNNLIEMRAPVREQPSAVAAPAPQSSSPLMESKLDVNGQARRHGRPLSVECTDAAAIPPAPAAGGQARGSGFDQFVPSAGVAKAAAEAAAPARDANSSNGIRQPAANDPTALPATLTAARGQQIGVEVISEIVNRVLAQMLPEIFTRIALELEAERGRSDAPSQQPMLK